MNSLLSRWEKLSLQLRLHILIQGCLIIILIVAQLWLMDQFRHHSLEAVELRAEAVADGAINGLNTMMVTKFGDDDVITDKAARALFIQKMGAAENINELRIIRTKQLESQYSAGLPQEQPTDAIDYKVLAGGKKEFNLMPGSDGAASIRAEVPFIASKNFRSTNCLKCHDVAEGTVLGAASVTIDVTDDLARIQKDNVMLWFGQGIMQIFLYFGIGLIVRRLSRQLGGEPGYVIDIVRKIAKGNLSQQITTRVGDSTSLLAAVKQMQSERKQAEVALEEKRLQLADIVAFLPDATMAVDKDRRITIWNKAIEKMTGIPAAEMLGKGDHTYMIPFYGEARSHLLDLAFLDDSEIAAQYPKIQREGDAIVAEAFCNALDNNKGAWVFAKASPLHDRSGNVVGAIEVIRDVSKDKRAEEQLRLSASVFTYAREAIIITDDTGIILEVNDAFTTITGYSREEAIGQNPNMLKSGRQEKGFYVVMWRSLMENGHWHGEVWNRHKNGEVYAELLTISAVRDKSNNTRHYVALFTDITKIKEHQSQLEHIANFDALTALPNRLLLADRLLQAILQCKRQKKSLAVVYFDLDGFKAVNDNHGHAAGDQLLITLAGRMKRTLREGDTLARIGGDEFVAVLLDLTDEHSIEPMLTRLLVAAAKPVQVGDIQVQVSTSLGVAFYPQKDDVDADQLLRQADQAMYQAKVTGKNRYCTFDAEQDRSVRGYHEKLEQVRLALINNEFVLYYQPKVNMRTGEIIGAEALIRWQHPEKGLIAPAQFLPLIEDHSIAVQLGEWVIDTALVQIERWQAEEMNIPVSVNIGARQLQGIDFVENLAALLKAHPTVKPSDLELEVLETSALEDITRVSQVINACGQMGVGFALDDFGTGYSSLTYLKRLPVSLLKIDQSFVRDMLDDPDDLSIIQGVLGLARAFGRKIIAEGVETSEHGRMLLRLGCEHAQGYGIARPMPAGAMKEWSATWRTHADWLALPSVHSDDLPLIFGAIEHRAALRIVEECMKEGRPIPLHLVFNQRHLGKWLEHAGAARFGGLKSFQSIERLHREIHTLIRHMGQIQSEDAQMEAQVCLDQLRTLCETLLEQLKVLEQESGL